MSRPMAMDRETDFVRACCKITLSCTTAMGESPKPKMKRPMIYTIRRGVSESRIRSVRVPTMPPTAPSPSVPPRCAHTTMSCPSKTAPVAANPTFGPPQRGISRPVTNGVIVLTSWKEEMRAAGVRRQLGAGCARPSHRSHTTCGTTPAQSGPWKLETPGRLRYFRGASSLHEKSLSLVWSAFLTGPSTCVTDV